MEYSIIIREPVHLRPVSTRNLDREEAQKLVETVMALYHNTPPEHKAIRFMRKVDAQGSNIIEYPTTGYILIVERLPSLQK